MWRRFKFSVKISWQTPSLIRTVSVSSWIVQQQSSWTSFQIFSTFPAALLVLDHTERLSSSTDTQPSLNVNAILNLLSGLKNVLQKPLKVFQQFW
jgi:hypothetical protein